MVAQEDDHRVVSQTELVDRPEHLTDGLIDRGERAVVERADLLDVSRRQRPLDLLEPGE